jgi:hypothetical protein
VSLTAWPVAASRTFPSRKIRFGWARNSSGNLPTATLSNPDCAALTGVAGDGTVYGTIRSFSGAATGALCRWNATTQATAWCVAVGRLPLEFRAHPNRIFLDGKVLDAATGQAVSDTYRLFFGHYAFASNQVFGVN